MNKIICNPLNLEYRYQIKKSGKEAVFREAADPTMLLFKGRYLMFVSMSGGFWHSDDLYSWEFHETPELPIYDYAPDVREVNGKVVFSASKRDEPCSFFVSGDPLNEPFTAVSVTFPFWDPATFQDDDGRVYFYWGCTNTEPIWGIEIDPATMQPIGEKVGLFGGNEDKYGWERKGENNKGAPPRSDAEIEMMVTHFMASIPPGAEAPSKEEMAKTIRHHLDNNRPYIEGAYMTKHNGKYYLQYAGPGTECNVYSDGVYVGDAPLGPFTYQEHNPFSSKPGGFIPAAGHGSTFQDKAGNWWHVSTMGISVNENFERRIGLFPCDFDGDGTMYCNQNFADYPFRLPDGKRGDMDTTQPAMILLSYNAKPEASSAQDGYASDKAADENVRTWWAAETNGKDEWLKLDLGEVFEVNAVQLNFADHKIPMPENWEKDAKKSMMEQRLILVKPQRTRFLLEGSEDGTNWHILKDCRNADTDFSHDFICFDGSTKLRFIKVSHIELPFNAVPAVSGLRVFGKGAGTAPAAVTEVDAPRTEERMNILLKWKPSANADGYNVRYGIAEDKLYSSWQVYGKSELDLSMIGKASGYYIAVDSFNRNGVTEGKVIFVS